VWMRSGVSKVPVIANGLVESIWIFGMFDGPASEVAHECRVVLREDSAGVHV
jgi:hypothetical protein